MRQCSKFSLRMMRRGFYCFIFLSLISAAWAKNEGESVSDSEATAACEEHLGNALPGERYLRARATLENSNSSPADVSRAFSDFRFLMKVPPEGKFSFQTDLLDFLASEFLRFPKSVKSTASVFLLEAKRPEDLQVLSLAEKQCQYSNEPHCSAASLAALRDLMDQWAGKKKVAPVKEKTKKLEKTAKPTATPKVVNDTSEAPEGEEAPPTDENSSWQPNAEDEAPQEWSAGQENSWAKMIGRERSDVKELIKEQLTPLLLNPDYQSKNVAQDEEVIAVLKTILFPAEDAWRGGIEIPDSVFDIIKGNQNPWEPVYLRALSMASMIMQRYSIVLKQALENAVQDAVVDNRHPVVEALKSRAQFYKGYSWIWTADGNKEPDSLTQKAWPALQPLVRFMDLNEYLLRYSAYGLKRAEGERAPRVHRDLVNRFVRSLLLDSGVRDVLVERGQTADRLKSILRKVR
jgi:hypothetical protein